MVDHQPLPAQQCEKLKNELLQREAELAIINSVQEGLASRLEVQAIYDLVGEKIREIFNAQVVMISTYDAQSHTVEHRYMIERGRRIYFAGPHPPGGFRSKIITSRQPLLVNTNVGAEAARLGQPTIPGTITPKSWLGVPLFVGQQVTGVLSLQNVDIENAFQQSDVRLLQTLAASMSVALENARLFDQAQHLLHISELRTAELQIINSVQEGLAQKLDAPSIYSLVGTKILEMFGNKSSAIFIQTLDTTAFPPEFPFVCENWELRSTPTWKPDYSLIRAILETNETIFMRSRADLKTYGMVSSPLACAVFVPILSGANIHGIIVLTNPEQEYAFSDADVRLLETLANSMSIALENARLWEQENRYRQALEREFEIGREIQAGFLPKDIPQPRGWEIAAMLKPAREVAGDFYDVFTLPEGKLGLVISDVCDKGLGAALFMTLIRSLLRAVINIDFYARSASSNNSSPAIRIKNAVSLTNNYIVETHGDTGMFATVFLGILDARTGVLTYVNGGHLPPILINTDGATRTLDVTGPAVGAVPDVDYTIREVMIERGSTFFAYTDGLTDAENPGGERFGQERILPLLTPGQVPNRLVSQFQEQIEQHAAGAKQYDDITLLVVRRKG